MIFDLILIIIFIVLIAINIRRGAAKSLARIITTIAAYAVAAALGTVFSASMYNTLVRPALSRAVTNAVSGVSVNAAGSVVQALPTWLTGLLNITTEDFTNLLAEPMSGVSDTISQAVNTAVQPVAMGLLTFFITIIIFFIFALILRKLFVRPLAAIFRIPGLNVINRFLGAVIGFADAFLLVSMLAYLTKLILVNIGTDSTWFNESTIYNSFIFYHFYSGNIFTWITSALAG